MAPAVEANRTRWREIVDRPWTWMQQVHGATIVTVSEPGGGAGTDADAAVTRHPGAALAVFTADCAAVALASPEGVIGAVHAGWRGVVAGVLEEAVAAMRAIGATHVDAALGPCIRPECYEFSEIDLDAAAARYGDHVRGRSAGGGPAFDMPAAVRGALEASDAALVHVDPGCTACGPAWFSHRARGDVERQAMVVWTP